MQETNITKNHTTETVPPSITDLLRLKKIVQEHLEVEVLQFGRLYPEDRMYVSLRFHLPHFGYDKDVQIPLSDVHRCRLTKYIPDGFVMSGVDLNQQSKAIAKKILEVMQQQTAPVVCLLQQGYNYIESLNRWTYVLGNQIIGIEDTCDKYLPMNPLNVALLMPFDDTSDIQRIVKWCKRYVRQGDAQAALFLTALSSFISPILHALQLSMAEALNAYIVGPTGVGKTAFAELLTVITSEHRGLNLASDMKIIYSHMCHYVDLPVLIDDMNRTSSEREFEAKKKRLSELIQAKSSAGLIESSDGQRLQLHRTGLIISAEVLLPNPSTINRCVVIRHETPFNREELTVLQQTQYLYIQFILAFTEWICQNQQSLTNTLLHNLKQGMYDYLDGHLDANQYKGYLRVMQSHKILRLTEQLFLWFLQDSTTNNNHGNTQKALSHGIRTAIANTLEAIKQENQSDLLYTIAEIFAQDPDRVVAADPDEYDDNSLFVRYGRLIYFRGDSVATYLSGKLDHELTVKSLSSQLSRAYLLESYGMELSGPLPKTLRKRLKLKNRERYYKLSVPALCELIIQAFPSPFERMASPLEEIRLSKGKG